MADHRASLAAVSMVAVLAASFAGGCKKDASDPAASATVTSGTQANADAEPVISKSAKLAAIGMSVSGYEKPTTTAKRIGYLRLGAIVPRSDQGYGNADSCPGGWYAVAPKGFVCTGRYATLDLETPLVKAASVRPDTSKPLPYAYGFMRSVAPLYTRMPSRDEQIKAEYKLKNHFRWFGNHMNEEQRLERGAHAFARALKPVAAQH